MQKHITQIMILCLLCFNAFDTWAKSYYVTAKSLNICSGAGSQNAIVGKLTQGQQVDVKNQSNGWSQVEGGWVASSFLANKIGLNIVTENTLKIVCNVVATPFVLDGQDVIHYTTNIEASTELISSSYQGGDICNRNKCDIDFSSESITWKTNNYNKNDFITNKGSIDRRTGVLQYRTTRGQNGYWEMIGTCKKREQIKKKF